MDWINHHEGAGSWLARASDSLHAPPKNQKEQGKSIVDNLGFEGAYPNLSENQKGGKGPS